MLSISTFAVLVESWRTLAVRLIAETTSCKLDWPLRLIGGGGGNGLTTGRRAQVAPPLTNRTNAIQTTLKTDLID